LARQRELDRHRHPDHLPAQLVHKRTLARRLQRHVLIAKPVVDEHQIVL
jgi:hypothetical protein